MPYPIKKSSRFHSKKIRLLRSLKIYGWRAFCVLLVFFIGSSLLYMSSTYFRTQVLKEIDRYSVKFGYVIKEIEIQKENSSEYCVNLDEQSFLTKYRNLSTILFSAHELKKEIEAIGCVDAIDVRKIFPFKIKLTISHKVPAAIWQNGKTFYFITMKGEVMKIRSNKNLSRLVLITGCSDPEYVTLLLKFISKDKEVYSKISTAVWIGKRRWNIIFNNGTKLMLPEELPEDAWTKFIKLQKTHADFKNLKYKIVDFRVTSKIYVR